MQVVRYLAPDNEAHVGLSIDGVVSQLHTASSVSALLREPRAQVRRLLSETSGASPADVVRLLAPIDGGTDVWAAGVTYERSEQARVEESQIPDVYSRVYEAARPELFFKATARRVVGPDATIGIRDDSHWDVPEPELAVVVNAYAEVVGYTIVNDVSSRQIESENPLYLPQAKVYAGSCALGPGIVPEWEIDDPYALTIRLQVTRHGDGWEGQASTASLHRTIDELVACLFHGDTYPDGVVLSTGTPLVPDPPFTLEAEDVVEITIDKLDQLRNTVVRGKEAFTKAHWK